MSMESSVALLESVIKQLSSSSDIKSREFEKEKLQQDLKNADEKLATLVEDNQEHLKKTVQSFGSVVTRVETCRARIKILHDKLSRCRTLLHCNRADLQVHWQEGLECSEKLNLLDKIEKAVTVPEQLDRYMTRKHFLHAAQLLTETVENLDGPLSSVEALRDLRASLHTKKAILHEYIIDELNKQIYSEDPKILRKPQSNDGDATSAFKRTFTDTKAPKRYKNDVPIYSDNELIEDLQKDPEENIPLFMNLMVKALVVLDKIPEAIEAFKVRIKRDMMMIIRRATDQISKRAVQNGDVVTIEELQLKTDTERLLELLQLTFDKFRNIAYSHAILLSALHQTLAKMPAVKVQDINLYTKDDIWSKIQFAIKDMLHPYLDMQNISTPQQTLSSFGTTESAVAGFFTAKKRIGALNAPSKPRSTQLFRFECSSSAQAIHSYMREQDIASALPEDTYADYIVWNAPQLLCKPQATNITAIFIPVMDFVKDIDEKTSTDIGTNGVLYHFITDFVRKVFIDQILFEVSEKARAGTKGHEALRNLCDNSSYKKLNLQRPLLKGTVIIHQIMEELFVMMKKLPTYSNEFVEIIIRTLNDYFESCNNAYKSLIFREGEGKGSRVISANWVKDDDIKRLLVSLPNWSNMKNPKPNEVENDDSNDMNDRLDRETSLLTSNLEKTEIEKNQVILDPPDLKAIANLQESLEWLHEHINKFITAITAQTTGIKVQSKENVENLLPQKLSSLTDDTVKALNDLSEMFEELSDSCLLLLHLEIRCHCFYFLGRTIRECSYVCSMGAIDVDVQIPLLVKDLRDVQDLCNTALPPPKSRYLFEGLGFLIARIIISSTSCIKKINRNGVKKMCQNIFTIQQELSLITMRRETSLDVARQYFELLYNSPDEILNMIHEQGSRFKEQDYANALELLSRSDMMTFNKDLWKLRRNKLSEILKDLEKK